MSIIPMVLLVVGLTALYIRVRRQKADTARRKAWRESVYGPVTYH